MESLLGAMPNQNPELTIFDEPSDAEATHLGWQLAAADGDHDVLPQLEFIDTSKRPDPAAAPEPKPELEIIDQAIDDATLASPPVLWDGEATFQEPMVVFGDAASPADQKTVFS